MIVVDDALLLAVIAEQPIRALVPYLDATERGEVFTTGSWYWRLARAAAHPGRGALSRALAALPTDEQHQVRRALEDLPPEIGLLSLRGLTPVMTALPGQLNLLTAEAVAAAVVLGADIVVTTDSPLLSTAANAAGVSVRLLDLRL